MKIYFIYKKYEGLRPSLYAISESKTLKDIFMSERKEEMFVCIKKEIDDKKFMCLKDSNYKYFLDRRGYYTSSSSSKSVYIVSTYNEEMNTYLSEENVFSEISKYTNPISKAFNKELMKALHNIGYFDVFKYMHMNDPFVQCIEKFDSFPLEVDRLGVFIYLYGSTFKEKIL